MSERKVLNKYFPPDFDPSKIPRRKQPKDAQQVVRLMAPFSMRCNTCGEYTYKGKKFNARKETVQGEDYFGIKIFRFYIKCPRCSAEITFKTDPKNTDYAAEHGASRNFEPWRDAAAVEASDLSSSIDPLAHLLAAEAEEAEQEDLDPMKSLEARTLDSRREMEILDALQDIRTRNARNERIDESEILEELKKERERKERLLKEQDPEEIERKRLEEEDEKLVRKYFNKIQDIELEEELEVEGEEEGKDQGIAESSKNGSSSTSTSTSKIIKRARPMEDQDQDEVEEFFSKKSTLEKEPDLKSLLSESARAQLLTKSSTSMAPPPSKKKKGKSAFGIVKKKS